MDRIRNLQNPNAVSFFKLFMFIVWLFLCLIVNWSTLVRVLIIIVNYYGNDCFCLDKFVTVPIQIMDGKYKVGSLPNLRQLIICHNSSALWWIISIDNEFFKPVDLHKLTLLFFSFGFVMQLCNFFLSTIIIYEPAILKCWYFIKI